MKVRKVEENFYILESTAATFVLNIISSKNLLTFLVKDNTNSSSLFYKGNYTLGSFIDIDRKFRSFYYSEEILVEIQKSLETQEISIEKNKHQLIITLFLLGSEIKIPLTNGDQTINNTPGFIEKILLPYKDQIQSLNQKLADAKKENKSLKAYLENQSKLINTSMKSLKSEIMHSIEEITLKAEHKRRCSSDMLKSKNNQIVLSGINYNVTASKSAATSRKNSNSQGFEVEKLKLMKEFKDHSDFVLSICLSTNGKLASSSADGTIKIFNTKTFQLEQTLVAHKDCINYVSFSSNGDLISSSKDNTIKVWKLLPDSYKLVHTIEEENEVNKAIEISGNRIGSCTGNIVKIYQNHQPFECIKTMVGHTGGIKSLIETANKKYIVSCSGIICNDNTLRFWNAETYQSEKVIEGVRCYSNNSMIDINDLLLVSDFEDGGEIKVIDMVSMEITKVIKDTGLNSFTSFCLVDGGVLCGCSSGNKKYSFVFVDTEKFKITKKKEEVHNHCISGLVKVSEHEIISCSYDRVIKVWKN